MTENELKMGRVHSSTWRQPKSNTTPNKQPLSGPTPWHSRRSHHHVQYPLLQDHPRQANVTNTIEDFGTDMTKNKMIKKRCPRTAEKGARPEQHLESTQVRHHTQQQPLSGPTPLRSIRSHHHVQPPLLQDHPRQANFTFTIEKFGTGRPRKR